MHNANLENGMLNRRLTVEHTHSNRYQAHTQVDMVTFHFIYSGSDNIEELYDLHHIESTTECLEFIDSLLGDKNYLFQIPEHAEGGERGPHPTLRESNTDTKSLMPTSLPGGSDPPVNQDSIFTLGE